LVNLPGIVSTGTMPKALSVALPTVGVGTAVPMRQPWGRPARRASSTETGGDDPQRHPWCGRPPQGLVGCTSQFAVFQRNFGEQRDELVGSRDHEPVPGVARAPGPVRLLAHRRDLAREPVAPHRARDGGRALLRQRPVQDGRRSPPGCVAHRLERQPIQFLRTLLWEERVHGTVI